MRPPVLDITSQNNLPGQKIDLGFDETSIPHLMSLLTDLYSDAELAVIREYATNALDAHKEAGNTAPIEVSTPTSLSPYFKVKDYGVGLSVDDIVNIYSKYGASTKRDNDYSTGMLGVGAKSALTYTDQFTVTSVKAGIKIVVLVSRKEDGSGMMQVIDTVSTDEPNGVEISVPVQRYNDFDSKAKNLFKYWPKGSVLLNGAEPARVEMTPVTDRTFINHNGQRGYGGSNGDVVVMGGVAYPVKDGLYSDNSWRTFQIIAFVEIGEVHFTPSREALNYTSGTNATIEELRKEFRAGLEASMQKDVDLAPTHAEALIRAHNWQQSHRNISQSHFTYKGLPLVRNITGDFTYYSPNVQRYACQSYSQQEIAVLAKSNVAVIVNVDIENISTAHRRKAKAWAEDNDHNGDFLFVRNSDLSGFSPWVDGLTKVEWEEIRSIKLPASTGGGGYGRAAREGLYDVLESHRWTQTDEIADDLDVFYITRDDYPKDFDSWSVLRAAFKDVEIVRLGRNQVAKFLRNHPEAKHLRPALVERSESDFAKLTDKEKQRLLFDSYEGSILSRWDADKIDDPEVKELIEVVGGQKPQAVVDFEAMENLCRMFYIRANKSSAGVPLENILSKRYPLMNSGNKSHSYIYCNAAYHALYEKKGN